MPYLVHTYIKYTVSKQFIDIFKWAWAGHIGWQPEGQPGCIGIMNLYIHQFLQAEWSITVSQAGRRELDLESSQQVPGEADPGWEPHIKEAKM